MKQIKKHVAVGMFNLLSGTWQKFPVIRRFKQWLLKQAGILTGNGTTVVGPIECTGTLTIGDNTWIGKNFKVNGNGSVRIGSNVDIGPEVTFQTGTHCIGSHVRRAGEGKNNVQNVGNGVWIGCRVVVVNNTSIGEGSVIAAGAVVVSDIGNDVLVGGIPAKVIKNLSH